MNNENTTHTVHFPRAGNHIINASEQFIVALDSQSFRSPWVNWPITQLLSLSNTILMCQIGPIVWK